MLSRRCELHPTGHGSDKYGLQMSKRPLALERQTTPAQFISILSRKNILAVPCHAQ